MEARATLVAERRWSKVRIARVDRRATGQRHVCQRWTAITQRRTKQRIVLI